MTPPRFCPDAVVTRAQMASFLVRAFGIPAAAPAGFADVGPGSVHAGAIDGLAATAITKGCDRDPLRYCPQELTTRAQMASFLARAINWQESGGPAATDEEPPGVPYDVDVSVQDGNVTVRWREPAGGVDHYLIQWRHSYEEFNQERQLTVDPVTLVSYGTGTNRVVAFTLEDIDSYMVRVLAVNKAGMTAGHEVLIPSHNNRLRYVIENRIVAKYKDEFPWLEEVWNYMNQPFFVIEVGRTTGTAAGEAHFGYRGGGSKIILWRPPADLDLVDPGLIGIAVHEMAHIYTLTDGIAERPGLVGLAHLYHSKLANEIGPLCESEEIYADTIAALVIPDSSFYWTLCFSSSGVYEPTAEALHVVQQAFSGQIPDWFHDNYGRYDGTLDLEGIWSEVKALRDNHHSKRKVFNQLEDLFGGYCSTNRARHSVFGSLEVRNPWRDGGCTPQAPRNVDANAGDSQITLNWQPPVYDGGENITSYVIQWKHGDQNYHEDRQRTVQPTTHTGTIEGLTNGVDYTLRVIAVNGFDDSDHSTLNDGWGTPSQEVTATPTTVTN